MNYTKSCASIFLLTLSSLPETAFCQDPKAVASSSSAVTPDPSSAVAALLRRRAAQHVCTKPSGAKLGEVVGIASHMEQAVGSFPARDKEIAYIVQNGMRVRHGFLWEKLEPAPDTWRFDTCDGEVELAQKHGIPTTAMLSYHNPWAMSNPADYNTIDPQLFARYVGKVAQRYCNTIKSYEIWNEPDLNQFFLPAPNPAHYGVLLKAAASAVRTNCPDATVITGGLSAYSPGGDRWWFLEKLYESHPDICSSFDAVGLHPYTADQRFSPEQEMSILGLPVFQNVPNMLKRSKEILGRMGCPQKPLWITEVGWPSYANLFQGLAFQITIEKQADFLARGLLLALKEGVATWFWYTFRDEIEPNNSPRPHEFHFGLFFPLTDGQNAQIKPAGVTYSRLVKELGALRYSADISRDLGMPEGVFALLFMADDCTRKVVFWDGREDLVFDALGLRGSTFTAENLAAPAGFLWKSATPMREIGVEWDGAWTSSMNMKITGVPVVVTLEPK